MACDVSSDTKAKGGRSNWGCICYSSVFASQNNTTHAETLLPRKCPNIALWWEVESNFSLPLWMHKLLFVSFSLFNKLPCLSTGCFPSYFLPCPTGKGVIEQLEGHRAPSQGETPAAGPVSVPSRAVQPARTYCRETLASGPSGAFWVYQVDRWIKEIKKTPSKWFLKMLPLNETVATELEGDKVFHSLIWIKRQGLMNTFQDQEDSAVKFPTELCWLQLHSVSLSMSWRTVLLYCCTVKLASLKPIPLFKVAQSQVINPECQKSLTNFLSG